MLIDLGSKLAGGGQDKGPGGAPRLAVQAVEDGQHEGRRLAAARHGAREHVAAFHGGRNRVLLDRGGTSEAHLLDAAEEIGV